MIRTSIQQHDEVGETGARASDFPLFPLPEADELPNLPDASDLPNIEEESGQWDI